MTTDDGLSIPALVEVHDPRMSGFRHDPKVRVHFDGGRWLEGPAYSAQSRTLLFSDIPSERALRYDEVTGRTEVFDASSRFANGRTYDGRGRLVTCLHGDRAVVRREHDGTETVIARDYRGARLNSPNDVVVDSSGAVWFTDPTYGILTDYEGHRASSEIAAGVYVVAPGAAGAEVAAEGFAQPNGLAFSPDESRLYVVDSERDTLAELEPGARPAAARVIASGHGFDGIRVDDAGRIWAGTRAGATCFDPDGTALVTISLPEQAANLEFGGPRRNILYITATTSLYSIMTSAVGAGGRLLP